MNKRIERCTMAAAMALGSMAIAGLLNTAQAGLPPVQHQGSVQYVSGGIGLDESEALKAAAGLSPGADLRRTGRRQGRLCRGRDRGHTRRPGQAGAARATSEGPYMLVKLPAGDYKVSATYKAGQTQERQVAVKGAGAARAVFEWK